MSELHIDVVTPKGIHFSGESIACTAPGSNGEFQLLKDHAAFIAVLRIGALKFNMGNNIKIMATSGGFLEVRENRVSIIVESAEWAENIQVDRARGAEKRARERLSHPETHIDVERAQLALARALNQLKIASN